MFDRRPIFVLGVLSFHVSDHFLLAESWWGQHMGGRL